MWLLRKDRTLTKRKRLHPEKDRRRSSSVGTEITNEGQEKESRGLLSLVFGNLASSTTERVQRGVVYKCNLKKNHCCYMITLKVK